MYLPKFPNKSVSDPMNNAERSLNNGCSSCSNGNSTLLNRRFSLPLSFKQQDQKQEQGQEQCSYQCQCQSRLDGGYLSSITKTTQTTNFLVSSEMMNEYNDNDNDNNDMCRYRSISVGGKKDFFSSSSSSSSAAYSSYPYYCYYYDNNQSNQSQPPMSVSSVDFSRKFFIDGCYALSPNTTTITTTTTTNTKNCHYNNNDATAAVTIIDTLQNNNKWIELDTTITSNDKDCSTDWSILMEYQRLLPKWKGPLSPFGHYWINTKISLLSLKCRMEEILLLMVENHLVDYTIDENYHCIHGRAFGRYESCTFVVALFNFQYHCNDNDHDSDSDNGDDFEINITPDAYYLVKPLIEIRRMSGDGFVFENFFSSFIKQMNQKQMILLPPNRTCHCRDNNTNCKCSAEDAVNANANANAIDNVNENIESNDQLMDLDLDLNVINFDVDLSDLSSLTMESCQNLSSSDNYEESDDTDSSKIFKDREDELRDWFNSIIDRNSYGDYIRFCTVKLLEAFENCHNHDNQENDDDNKELMSIHLTNIAKTFQRYIVDELMTLITSDFYDVFCIRNIIKIVHYILKAPITQHRGMYQNLKQVKQQIQQVKNQWSNKCSFRMSSNSSIEFERSQQIVQCCNSCLDTILAKLTAFKYEPMNEQTSEINN